MLCSLCSNFDSKTFPLNYSRNTSVFSGTNKLNSKMCWARFLSLNLHGHQSFDFCVNRVRIRPIQFIIIVMGLICILGCAMMFFGE